MIHYPKDMKLFATAPDVKKTFVSEIQPTAPDDCINCGGAGIFALFCGRKGPFQTPNHPYSTEKRNGEEVKLNSHYENGVGWWIGETICFDCPECTGLGKTERREIPVNVPLSADLHSLTRAMAHPYTGEILERA